MSKKLYVGVDAGGTKTDCLIIDAEGNCLARQKSGPGSLVFIKHQAGDNIRTVISEALKELETPAPLAAIFLGIAGVNSTAEAQQAREILTQNFQRQPPLVFEHFELNNDTRALQTAAFGHQSGITLICGTGSKCYGATADGREAVAGGLGFILNDEGSAYDLGRRILKRIARGLDGRDSDAVVLRNLVFKKLNLHEVGDISAWISSHHHTEVKFAIAKLAPLADEAILAGDKIAQEIFEAGMDAATELVAAVATRLELAPANLKIAVTGGVITHPVGAKILSERLALRLPGAATFIPQLPPVAGAALRALQLGGVKITPKILEKIQNTLP